MPLAACITCVAASRIASVLFISELHLVVELSYFWICGRVAVSAPVSRRDPEHAKTLSLSASRKVLGNMESFEACLSLALSAAPRFALKAALEGGVQCSRGVSTVTRAER